MTDQLTLFHYWRSSCSWRVRWALAVKGVAYESVPVNILAAEHRSESYRAKNPSGFLPCLKVGDQYFGESLALIEWIDETFPGPSLMPKDPQDRMRVRQLAMIIAAGTQPLQNPSVIGFYTNDAEKKKEYAAHFITKGLEVFDSVRSQGAAGLYSFGDDVTIADLCLIPQIYNGLRFDVDMAKFSALKDIYDRCLKLPACDQAAPHNQPGATA